MSVIKYQFRDVEKIKTSIWQDARKGSIHIAQVIAQAIKEKAAKGEAKSCKGSYLSGSTK